MQYGQDIVFADDGSVQASRFIGYLPGDMTADSPLRSAAQQEAMVEKLKTITHGSSLDCFSFSFVMLVWEVWTELIVQMFINLGQVSWQTYRSIFDFVALIQVLSVRHSSRLGCARRSSYYTPPLR